MSKSKKKEKLYFYEFMIFSQNGVLLYFEDLKNKETIDIEKRLDNDKEYRNRM